MADNSGSTESCTNWASRFVSSTNMGNEAFLEPQDSSAPANGQIIRRAYFSSRHFCQYFSLHRADSWLLLEICCWVSVFELALTVTHDQSVMTHWQVEGLHFISPFTKKRNELKRKSFWAGVTLRAISNIHKYVETGHSSIWTHRNSWLRLIGGLICFKGWKLVPVELRNI